MEPPPRTVSTACCRENRGDCSAWGPDLPPGTQSVRGAGCLWARPGAGLSIRPPLAGAAGGGAAFIRGLLPDTTVQTGVGSSRE
ncbi:hypothetical protein chiPu_0023653, partial [Chiloscyllium punctatum]|nr:hypothetical protein [Chiloscyllium punctatum]